MKLEALRRSVVRLFRKSDTSVPPKIEPTRDPNGYAAVLTPGLFGYTASIEYVRPPWMPTTDATPIDPRAGIKPPLDPGTNGWTWSQWSKEAAGAGTIPGWAFCRFANRLGSENVGFVFGHVRGGFGVWRQPFDVCTGHDEGVQQKSEILTCVTHLPSGTGIGIFIDRDTAIMAAELAERVCPAWQDDADYPSILNDRMSRTLIAWHGLGIRTSVNAHAHDQHGTQFPIYGQDNESVMAGKPERLS